MSLFMLAAYGFACAAVYHLCPAKIRWVVLLLASYGFYAFGCDNSFIERC